MVISSWKKPTYLMICGFWNKYKNLILGQLVG
jgi:hypothetical protein